MRESAPGGSCSLRPHELVEMRLTLLLNDYDDATSSSGPN